MPNQLDLFIELKKCSYCGQAPPPKKGKEYLFNGFRDASTGHLVCWGCRDKHDQFKETIKTAENV